jgi:Tol biopolymer transport system component
MRDVGIRNALIAAILAILPAGCGLLDPEDEAAPEQILFVTGGTSTSDVYRMNADGSGLVNLTRSPDGYRSLDITSDGRTVIFHREIDCHIWTMTPGGSDQKSLGGSCGRLPRLSPNGRLVAYESGNAIHVMNIDGTGTREVSDDLPPVQPSPCGQTPNWHVWPFGWVSTSRVAFRRHICGVGTTFYSVNADGTGLAEIDFNPQSAHLSPDAARLAFDRTDDLSTAPAVTIMNVDGSNRRIVAAGGALPDRFFYSRSPWSPNGRRLYYAHVDGHHIADVLTGVPQRLAAPSTDAEFLGWSRGGNRLLFRVHERNQSGAVVSTDLHAVNADGTGLVNLTRTTSFETEAVWVP